MSNKNLSNAKKAKNDEFYTQLYDIENEVLRYITPNYNPFDGKTVLCPCDDPVESNFTRFFALNFSRLGLKKLISTGYNKDGKGKVYVLTGDIDGNGVVDIDDIVSEDLEGDGDFRSEEVTRLRAEADIICTNPPFSLFREFINWINPDEKKFIILGTIGAAGYRDVFTLIKNNKIWLGIGANLSLELRLPDNAEKYKRIDNGTKYGVVPACTWYTNIVHRYRAALMELLPKSVHESNGVVYQTYYNYNAIDIPAVKLIPKDYTGEMGVPVSFLDRYNPEQFEIVGLADGELGKQLGFSANISEEEWSTLFSSNKKLRKGAPILINDQGKPEKHYARLIIRNKFNS